MSRGSPAGATVAITTVASGCSGLLFLVVLAVMAFVTRDSGGPVRVDDGAPPAPRRAAAEPPVEDRLAADAVVSAVLALEPALVGCFQQAHARDPSAGKRALLEVEVKLSAQGPTLSAARVKAAPSPFFRPCMARKIEVEAPGKGLSYVVVAHWDGEGVNLGVEQP